MYLHCGVAFFLRVAVVHLPHQGVSVASGGVHLSRAGSIVPPRTVVQLLHPRGATVPSSATTVGGRRMLRMRTLWRDLEDLVVRPLRASYDADEELLGASGEFHLRDTRVRRADFTVRNGRGQRLASTLYVPFAKKGDEDSVEGSAGERKKTQVRDAAEQKMMDQNRDAQDEGLWAPWLEDLEPGRGVVLYLHGNSGCRVDANEPAWYLLRAGLAVCCFDFGGCGSSGGDLVTLGLRETEDVQVIIKHLRERANCGLVALWGRSMGAVTAVRYAGQDGSVSGLVLDSPYAHLPTLLTEVAVQSAPVLPRWAAKSAVNALRKGLVQRVDFDMADMDTVLAAGKCFVPAIFGHGTEDTLVPYAHSKRVYDAYQGDKRLLLFQGGHNDRRPRLFYKQCIFFLRKVLEGGLKKSEELFWENIGPRKVWHQERRQPGEHTQHHSGADVRPTSASPILEDDSLQANDSTASQGHDAENLGRKNQSNGAEETQQSEKVGDQDRTGFSTGVCTMGNSEGSLGSFPSSYYESDDVCESSDASQ